MSFEEYKERKRLVSLLNFSTSLEISNVNELVGERHILDFEDIFFHTKANYEQWVKWDDKSLN